jgi:hypothetical protein
MNVLQSKFELMSHKQQQQQQLNSSKANNNLNRSVLDDDNALEIIELTLVKYQKFLDFLRNAG